MQIERMVKDPEYARNQFKRGGAFFQLMTEGVLTTDEIKALAPAIAADAVHIYEHSPAGLLMGLFTVAREIEKQAPEGEALFVALRLGMALGVGRERARRKGARA